MAYHYDIEFNAVHYTPNNLADNKAMVVWGKGESGLVFNKKLTGSFIFSRSGNEALYDALMAATHCDIGYISVLDQNDYHVVTSTFNKRDIIYRIDKCQLEIKPRYYDPNNIDAEIEKDFNIITDAIQAHTIYYNESYQFEYNTCTSSGFLLAIEIGGAWYQEDMSNEFPITKNFTCLVPYSDTWTFYSQDNTCTGDIDPITGLPTWNITTVWFREIKYVPKAVDPDPVNSPNPPPAGSGSEFVFVEEVSINGVTYNKYARQVADLEGVNVNHSSCHVSWHLSDYFGNNQIRTLTRARKLNDILNHFRSDFGCIALESEFFTNNVNPISGQDLTNVMIEQKSDAIFESNVESSDPATLGIITFKQLMDQLWAMFQVTWVIQDNILYVEHINFFRFNFSYLPNTTVGIDLTSVYPLALVGTYNYSFEQKLPIREKFSFMEAWNIDFIGADIEYTNCLNEGSTDRYVADLITTDIDPTYLDNEASKDGFVFFHCDQTNNVISVAGVLSGITFPNAHLSWANLHQAYWRSNRPLPTGYMNNELIAFNAPNLKLKKQEPIEFPFCVENFDTFVNDLVRTTMGDGTIEKAEYSFKTGTIKIELSYE